MPGNTVTEMQHPAFGANREFGMPRSPLGFALAFALTLPILHEPARADACTRDTLRKVVDEAGARLRVITAETQPRIVAAVRRLKEKRGWTGPEGDEKAAAIMTDARTAEYDTKSATLLALIDELGESGNTASPDCSRLAELEAAALELQATVRAKSVHIISRLEHEAGGASTAPVAQAPVMAPAAPAIAPVSPPAEAKSPTPQIIAKVPDPGSSPAPETNSQPAVPKSAPPAPESTLRRTEDAQPKIVPPPAKRADAAPSPQPKLPTQPNATEPPAAMPKAPSSGSWTTETSEQMRQPQPAPQPWRAEGAPPPPAQRPGLPPMIAEPSRTFSRDEIREASRGFFGTISGGLASVMEHAFSTLGRPTGYVLGNEGGGAFIAGVRYGSGTLFLHDGRKREVYWHGPSIGYDFGASGAKTMFLVYNLKDDIDIFSSYSGVEGSAYLVGGVGMTVLTDGNVIMAPIRSGLGVRIGANVGYIRFTARPTWNPF